MKNYFEQDLQRLDKDSTEYKLKKIYDDADDCFETRFDERASKNAPDKIQDLKQLIVGAKDVVMEDEHVKLYELVMGNIYLRLAQCQYEFFEPASYNHKKAISYLGENISLENNDEINCLMLLNKGKYFRNTARPGRKSNYEKACDIFADVMKKAACLKIDDSKKNHIILDAAINMGRVLRYSFDFDSSEKILAEIIIKLKSNNGLFEKYIEECNELKKFFAEYQAKSGDEERELPEMKTISGDYVTEYVLQALIHIGIIYRKRRKYAEAVSIFKVVNKIDSHISGENNIDAENNLGVCYRKMAEIEMLSTEEGHKHYNAAKKIFEELSRRGNNFAKINNYKCELIDPEGKFEKNIKNLKKDNKKGVNNNIKMLLARFYEKNGKYEKAEELFREIYKNFPYISRGSIGLKAYYHVAQCKMGLKEFHQAYLILQKIKELYKKNTGENDLLTEIDLGWCLMQKGNYEEAASIYESIRKKDISNLENKYLMRIYNNQCECYIHGNEFAKAEEIIKMVLEREPHNRTALYFRAYIHLYSLHESLPNRSESLNDDQIEKLNETCRDFSVLLNYKPIDERANSGWLISMILNWKYSTDKKELKEKIINKLKYSAEPVSMKCYSALTDFVLENMDDDGKSTLYRDYCHVKLTDHRDNRAFQHLMDSPDFRYFGWKTRARLLAYIVKTYEQVLKIKRISRYKFEDRKKDAYIPMHYTSIDTLKILLRENDDSKEKIKNVPKLRLWNTVYMNDDFEGGVFDKLLMKAAGDYEKRDMSDEVKDILKIYFGSPIARDVQLNSNVYITSFSKEYGSFQMWDIYAKKGKGCAIRFDEDFFNIRDDYEDLIEDEQLDGNPLYTVQYFDLEHVEDKEMNKDAITDIITNIWIYLQKLEELLYEQKSCGTENSDIKTDIKEDLFENAQAEVRSFIADRLNEIRYLFKTHLFQYEDELRLIRCSHKSMIDAENFDVPRLYIDVNKKIENIEVELGNKLNTEEIKELSTWLDNTNKVKKISVSKLSNAG